MIIVDKITLNAHDEDIVSQLHSLREQGYVYIGGGDGKIIYGLYKKEK